MSNKHSSLFRVMESLGYPEADIVRVGAALGVSYDKLNARADGLTPLSPLAASATWNTEQQRVFRQLQGTVKHLSKYTFSLDDLSKAVSIAEFDRCMAAAGADPTQRIQAKSAMASLRLIP